MKILFGHHGQRGDLAINLPAIEHLHRKGFVVDMPIHRQFADMAPLFLNLPYLNSVFITDDYEDFPSARDLTLLAVRKYDEICDPMQPHRMDRWHDHMHQTSCVLYDYANETLEEADQQINLVKWFDSLDQSGLIAFAPFAGNYAPGNPKALSEQRAHEIVCAINKAGYGVVQLGGPGEPRLYGTFQEKWSYFESVRVMLGCCALIHTDTGMGWVASGYKHPQLGLYSHQYYGEDKVHNIQPRNPNAQYLSAANVNEIDLDSIVNSLKLLL